jgi:putative transposase
MNKLAKQTLLLPLESKTWCLYENQLIQEGDNILQITGLKNGKAILQHTVTKEKKVVAEDALLNALQVGVVFDLENKLDGLEDLTESQKNELKIRNVSMAAAKTAIAKNRWIQAIHKKGIDAIKNTPRLRLTIEELSKTEMKGYQVFKISTLASSKRKLKENGNSVLALVPRFEDRGGGGKRRLHGRVEAIIEKELELEKNRTSNVTKKEIIENIQFRIKSENIEGNDQFIPVPSSSTINRRIKADISEYDFHVRKHGKKSADREFRDSGVRITAAHPLDVGEYDDVDLNVFAIDEVTMLPHGRAFLTSGIDQNTGVLMGYDFGYQHRSTESAINTILDGMLPKNLDLEKYKTLSHPWIGYGVFGVNLLDNALYNHSSETLRVHMEILNVVGWSRPHQPTDKSTIENFNKIVQNNFSAKLPGWVGTDRNKYGTARGIEGAIYTTQELERQFIKWVVGEYTHKANSDGTSPKERWDRHYKHRGPVVTLSRTQIELLKMVPNTKPIREGGTILVAGLRYGNEELQKIKRAMGIRHKLEIFESRDQLNYILVKHPQTGVLIKVECIEDEGYVTNLGRRQQNLIIAKARSEGYKHPDFPNMVEARINLRAETEKGRSDKKMSRRKLAIHYGIPEFSNQKISDPLKQEQEVVISDLEMRIYDLDHVVIDADGEWL